MLLLILFGVSSGIFSSRLSGILAFFLACFAYFLRSFLESNFANLRILSGIPSDMLAGILLGTDFDVLCSILSGIPFSFVCGIPSGIPKPVELRSTGWAPGNTLIAPAEQKGKEGKRQTSKEPELKTKFLKNKVFKWSHYEFAMISSLLVMSLHAFTGIFTSRFDEPKSESQVSPESVSMGSLGATGSNDMLAVENVFAVSRLGCEHWSCHRSQLCSLPAVYQKGRLEPQVFSRPSEFHLGSYQSSDICIDGVSPAPKMRKNKPWIPNGR